jgi:hypothetical protein
MNFFSSNEIASYFMSCEIITVNYSKHYIILKTDIPVQLNRRKDCARKMGT